MRSTAEALTLVRAFQASPEEEKSRELILALLEFTDAPFSRDQFHPGHSGPDEFVRYQLPSSIVRAAGRALKK